MSVDFLQFANPGIQGLMPYQPGKPIDELERELGITDIIKLASNENPLGLSEKAKAAVEAELSQGSRYPDGGGVQLKQSLSVRLGVKPEQITLGNGSNDVLELIARVFANPQSEVIFSQYAFAVYGLVTQAVGARAVSVPAVNWGHDLEAMAAAVTPSTRVIYLANPNNPTGTWFGKTELIRFMDQIPQDVLVVLDEAYIEYSQDADFPNGIQLLERYPNLIVTRTFSKAYGLASMRVGFAISNPQIADLLNRLRQPFNVNSFALAAANAVLGDEAYLQRSIEANWQGMQQFQTGLDGLGLSYIPSAGNFIAVDVQQDGMAVFQTLLYEGVIVRPVANYQMPQHLRISIGLQAENERCLAALSKVLGR